jgi:non-ribosomal peptide synthetase component F
VVSDAIHRLIEQQAATRGDALAYVDDRRALSYRELNHRANSVARALQAGGFRRGTIAPVPLRRSAEAAIALLAVLKAGGAYRWVPADGAGCTVCGVDPAVALAQPAQASPNLPILTRGTDAACVMPDGVLVPHATVAQLAHLPVPPRIEWSERAGALDLWMALMAGATVTCTEAPAAVAA